VAELQRHREQQSHRRRRHAHQEMSDLRVVTLLFPEHAERHHHHHPRQHQPDYRNCRADRATHAVAHDHAHVDRVQARQRLAHLECVEEIVVVEPAVIAHQEFAQVREYAAAEADRARHEEQLEDIRESRTAARRRRRIIDRTRVIHG